MSEPGAAPWRPSPRLLLGLGALLSIIALSIFALSLLPKTMNGLTSISGLAFGDDFINFWSAPRLAMLGRVDEVYDFERFHRFQQQILGGEIHLYHYSYPPSAILLALPFALMPYLVGWAVWIVGGWAVFALAAWHGWPVRPTAAGVMLYTLALPAVLANNMSGQTGTWMAAILGGGLMLLDRRPILAGALLGLLAVKPQLGLLVPVALLAGRHWRGLGSFLLVAVGLTLASLAIHGAEPWLAYADRTAVLRAWILENGVGVWDWMASPFVAARMLGLPVPVAYGAQALVATLTVSLVALSWRRDAPAGARNAVLVLCALLATPYVQLYDHVVAAFVPLWLWPHARRGYAASAALLLAAPAIGLALALMVSLNIAWLLLVPALALSVSIIRHGGASPRA